MRARIRRWLNLLPGWSTQGYARWSWGFLFCVAVLAILGPFLANEKPYFCRLEGRNYFPLFSSVSEASLSAKHPSYSPVDWHTTSFQAIWRAPIPYGPATIDLKTGALISPLARQNTTLRMRHWLGTDALGRDVLSGMIRGCRISLWVGLGSMLLALLIGLPLGSIAAYWGDRTLRISWRQVVLLLTGIIGFIFILCLPFGQWITLGLCFVWLAFFTFAFYTLHGKARRSLSIPVDSYVLGAVSILDGFPALFLVIILVAIVPFKGWLTILIVIALLKWPVMARYIRAEVFKLKETHYIRAAQGLNLSSWIILRRHIIPFAFRPVMISFIFGIASAIQAEATLSFLGIGVSPEQINWGRLLAQARSHFDAWWLMFLPGGAIFLTLLAFYSIGNAYQKTITAAS